MSAKKFLDNLTVNSPCTADWDSMIGNDQVRFCEHCALSVNNLSEMTHKQALRLVEESDGRVCIRYMRAADGRVLTKSTSQIHRIGRRASRIAAGAFSASLSISSAAAATLRPNASAMRASNAVAGRTLSVTELSSMGGTIAGIVFDQNGAVISGASVTLGTEQSKYAAGTVTSSDGTYKFDGLAAGLYSLKIDAPGFESSEVADINLLDKGELRIDRTLSIAKIEAEVEIRGGEAREETVLAGAGVMVLPTLPLVKAAHADDLEAVQSLVTRENVNNRDEATDYTALEYAALNGNREMVQLLLSMGADVNAKDKRGQTPLMMLDGDATADLVWDLINAGAKVNLRDKDGDTALTQMADKNNVEVLRTLLEAGAKVDTRNNAGKTALILAASEGLVNNVRVLINAGADINARDNDGKSALAVAIEEGHKPVIRLLRSLGAYEAAPAREEKEKGQPI
jgi:hypothetical protein